MVVLRGCKVLSIESDTVFFMKEKAKERRKLKKKLDFYMKLKSYLLPLCPHKH